MERNQITANLKEMFPSPEAAEQWFVKILDSINNGILVCDVNTVVRYINAEYTRITGVTEEQILGRCLTDVRPGAMLPRVIADCKPVVGAYRREGSVEYVVDMAPIIVNGDTVGGISVVKDITEIRRLSEELKKIATKTNQLKTMVDRMYKAKYTFGDIVGDSIPLNEAIRMAKRAAKADADVLISGESGTGKEVFAQAIHNSSNRAEGPFVGINCAAIAPSLIESELFGYEEGSFTGAKKGGRLGLFEIAGGGTVFLDEVAELSLEMQAKLLRVLQERSVRRIGETNEIPVDIRIIAATNKNPYSLVQDKKIRADFYYRLNVLSINLPPLRERGADVLLLADVFLQNCERKIGRKFSIDTDVKKDFVRYPWQGNVRELRNVIEYAVNMTEDSIITESHLPRWFEVMPGSISSGTLATIVQAFEKRVIKNMLSHYGSGVDAKRRIAKELDISMATLYNKLKESLTP